MAKKKESIPKQPTTKSGPKRKNPHAVALGKLGGKKGGKARAEKLTPERRREIAKKAVEKRWEREGPDPNVAAKRVLDAVIEESEKSA